jgi:DNA-binding NarL/FixJ family response regulator
MPKMVLAIRPNAASPSATWTISAPGTGAKSASRNSTATGITQRGASPPRAAAIASMTSATGSAKKPRVLMLTTFDLDEYVYRAIRAGASGFLLKDVRPAELVHAVRAIASGDTLLSPAITRRLLEEFVRRPPPGERPAALSDLTERESEVLGLVARGLSNAEIAQRLFLGETTVKTHVTRVLSKLGLRDRVQAVVLSYESGLVRPGDDAFQPRVP